MATPTVTPSAAPLAVTAPPASTTPAAPSPAPTSPGAPTATPTVTTPAVTPAADPNAPNLEILRNSHKALSDLGGLDRITPAVQGYTKIHDSTLAVATRLGYTPESFEEAFAEDPIGIANHLNQELSQAERNGLDTGTLIDRKLGPINDFIAHQMARDANVKIDAEFTSLLASHDIFKGKQVPDDVKLAISDAVVDSMRGDEKVQSAILKGDLSGVKMHFDKAVARFVAANNAYNKWASGGQPTTLPAAPGAPAPAGTPTTPGKYNGNFLNDLADGNENAFQHLTTTRR